MKRTAFLSQLTDAISAQCGRKRQVNWFDKLSDDAQQAILHATKQFYAGEYAASRKSVAKAITQCVTQECGASVSVKTVDEWLAKQKPD